MLRFYFYLDCTCVPFGEGTAPHKYQKCFREQIKSPSSSKLNWSLCVELEQYFSFNAQFETRQYIPFLNKVSYAYIYCFNR